MCENNNELISKTIKNDKTGETSNVDVDVELRKKLNAIILQSKVEEHKDIVNDYVEYGNSAMGWLSKTKK